MVRDNDVRGSRAIFLPVSDDDPPTPVAIKHEIGPYLCER